MKTTKREMWMTQFVSRLQGVVSPAFHEKTVLVVGLGGGSYMTEKLARLAPKKMILCDFDVVEVPNLSRTAYTRKDVGVFKVGALADRIHSINRYIQLECWVENVCNMPPALLRKLASDSDLVIAGTDQFEAQALLNEASYQCGTPAVFIGIHAMGEGGRVVWTLPKVTPCYRCVARERYEWFEKNGEAAVDMAAEPGSLVDAQFIDMVALKVASAIMDRGQPSMLGNFFERMALRNDIVVRCHPDYEWGTALWDAVLADLPTSPKQYAAELKDQVLFSMDTMWLRTEKDAECPVCSQGSPGEQVTTAK